MRPHHRILRSIAEELGGSKRGGRIHEKDFDSREDFEAEVGRRLPSMIIYSTEPLELEGMPSNYFAIQLPEVDELPGVGG